MLNDSPAPSAHRRNLLVRVGVVVLAMLLATVAAAALVPAAVHALAFFLAMLVILAICALPFALIFGIVYLVTHSGRPAAPAFVAPHPLGPAGPAAFGQAPHPGHAPRRPMVTPGGLPPRLQGIVARIHDKVGALRSPGQWPLLSPEDQLQVERVTDEYLPAVLGSYRSIPRGTQDWPVREGGPSVLEVIEHQLNLLDQSLDAVAERVFQAGAAHLLAQQQFLQERLGQHAPEELTIR